MEYKTETISKITELVLSKPTKTPVVFNNSFKPLQLEIINLLKLTPNRATTNGKIDYGKIYLRILEKDNLIKVDWEKVETIKLLSPESPDRITRKLMTYAESNNDLKFLLKYRKDSEDLELENKDYYRYN
jgi:hypothetical protein